jgi:hypothetical protein
MRSKNNQPKEKKLAFSKIFSYANTLISLANGAHNRSRRRRPHHSATEQKFLKYNNAS